MHWMKGNSISFLISNRHKNGKMGSIGKSNVIKLFVKTVGAHGWMGIDFSTPTGTHLGLFGVFCACVSAGGHVSCVLFVYNSSVATRRALVLWVACITQEITIIRACACWVFPPVTMASWNWHLTLASIPQWRSRLRVQRTYTLTRSVQRTREGFLLGWPPTAMVLVHARGLHTFIRCLFKSHFCGSADDVMVAYSLYIYTRCRL